MRESYKGYDIFVTVHGKNCIVWQLFKDGQFVLQDWNNAEGKRLTNDRQAMNDAKRNIDIFYRLNIA